MQKSTWTRSFAWPTAGSKPDGANDVTQDVLIGCTKQIRRSSRTPVKNWLIRVTVNRCKMLFRSPWHRHEDIDDYAETLSFGQPQDGETL